jgi:glycosyltransferase involved in cell wall biosynthesis
MKNEFADRAQKIQTVMNGYDEKDFPDKPTSKKEADFIVRYTGNFTDNQIVNEVWEAFSTVVEEHPLGQHIRFRFTGNVSQGIVDAIRQNGLEDRLEIQPYCPHEEAVRKMIDSDLLMLIIPKASNNELIITAKIFEYLASGSPILAVGPLKGDAAHVLQASERPPMFDYSEKGKIQSFIGDQLERWEAAETARLKTNSQAHRQFSRNAQARKLIDILQEKHNSKG